jgi:hypothetical protein
MCIGLGKDAMSILWIDACSWHDADASCRLFYELSEQGDALFGCGCLARGEQTMATQGNNLFQGFFGLRTDIESTMKSYAKAFGFREETTDRLCVDASVGLQGTNHHTICPNSFGKLYVALHTCYLIFAIDEIAFAGTNEYLDGYAYLDSRLYHPG